MSLTPAMPKIRFADPILTAKLPPTVQPKAPEPLPPQAPPPPDAPSTAHRQDSVALGATPPVPDTLPASALPDAPPPELKPVSRLQVKPGDTQPSFTRLNAQLRVGEKVYLGSQAGQLRAQAFVSDVKPIVDPLRERMGVPLDGASQPQALPQAPAQIPAQPPSQAPAQAPNAAKPTVAPGGNGATATADPAATAKPADPAKPAATAQPPGAPAATPPVAPPAGAVPVPPPAGAVPVPPPIPTAPVAPPAWLSKPVGSLSLADLADVAKLAAAPEYPGNLAKLSEPQRQLVKLVHDARLDKFLLAAPAKVTVPADQQMLADNVQKLVNWGEGTGNVQAYAAILPKALELDPTLKTRLTETATACLSRQFVDTLSAMGVGTLIGDGPQLAKLATALDTLMSKGPGGLIDVLSFDPKMLEALHMVAKILEGQKADPKLSLVPAKLIALLKTFPNEAPKVAALEKKMTEIGTKLAPYDKYFTDANFAKLTTAMTTLHDPETNFKDVAAILSLIDFMGLTHDKIKELLIPLGLNPKTIEMLEKSKIMSVLFAKPGSETYKILPNLIAAMETLSKDTYEPKDIQAVLTLVTSGVFAIDALESLAPNASAKGVIRELVEMARRGTIGQFNAVGLVTTFNTLIDKGVSLDSAEALLKQVGDLKLPPDDILRFLRLARGSAGNAATKSLLDRALANQEDFGKFLGHTHKVPPFLLDATGKTVSFEKFLKIETSLKSLSDGKFDENDIAAYFNLASLAPYDKIKDLIPAHVLGRFPALGKLLSDSKAVSAFFAGNVNVQKAIVGFINGDATALLKLLPSVAKGIVDATNTKGSLAAFVQVFDLGYELETKLVAAAETGSVDAFATLHTEAQTKLTATNAKLAESIKRHPEIKTPIQAVTPPSPAPAKADEILTANGLATPEELAKLKEPATGPKLAKLQELQTLEELEKKRPNFFEEDTLKLKTLKAEIGPELEQLKRLQEVKQLQGGIAELLGKAPLLKDNQLDATLVGQLESKLAALSKAGKPAEAIATLKLLQGVAGDKFDVLLAHADFDGIAQRVQTLQQTLIAQGVPAPQAEALVKKALALPELKTDFKPETILKALDDQASAVQTFEQQLGRKLGDVRLTPAEFLKSSNENLATLHKLLEPLAQGRDLKALEQLAATLLDDPRFFDKGVLKPDLLKSLLKHLETGVGAAGGDLAKLTAQLETLHLLGPEALEKILKLPEKELPAALEKLTAYADFAKANPALLQRGADKIELPALLDEVVKKDPTKIPVPQVAKAAEGVATGVATGTADAARAVEAAKLEADLKQANDSLRELLVKSGISDEKEIGKILGGFESYLKSAATKPEELAAVQKGLTYLKQLPGEALKGILHKDFNYRTLGPEAFASLNTVVDKLGKAGYAPLNIQRELIETLKKGPAGLIELSKQAKVLGAAEKLLAGLDPSLLADAAKTRELHAGLRKFLGGLPEIKPDLLEGLKVAITQTKRLDVAVAALGGLRPSDLEQVLKHPDHLTALFKQVEGLTAALDKAWGAVPAGLTPEAALKTLNNPQTRASALALLRSDRFWQNGVLNEQEAGAILRQLSSLEGDPVTANGLLKALAGLNDVQYEKIMPALLHPDKQVFKDIQAFAKEIEKLTLKTEGLKPEDILKARAALFDGLAARVVQNLDHPEFFSAQVKLAQQVATQLDALPFKLAAEARSEISTALLRIVNDPSLLSGKLPDPAKSEAAIKLITEKLATLKDSGPQLQDAIRGLREFSESRYIAEGLADPALIKGKFFEDLGKTVKTLDHASGDLGQLLSKTPSIITKYISLHGAGVAQASAQELLKRASSGEFDVIPGTKTPHPHAEQLKLLAIAGFGVNSLDALTSLLEVGGIELMGLGKQMAVAGAEFGIDMLINHYLQHPEIGMPQKLQDLVKSLALASALTNDAAFAAVQKLYPKIQNRGDLLLALGDSLATQDNVQLLSKSARLYFQKQVLEISDKGLYGKGLENAMAGLEKLAGYGSELASAVGSKLAGWAHDLAGTDIGKLSLAKLENWIEKAGSWAEGVGQKVAGQIEAAVEGLGKLARSGNEAALNLLRKAGGALETMGEGLMKQRFVQGIVNAVEGASGAIRGKMLGVLSEINAKLGKYASPAYDAIRMTLQKAGLLETVVKTEAKVLMQGAEFAGDAGKLEKAVARSLVGLEEVAAKKGMKTLMETLKLLGSTERAEKFLELLTKLPPGLAEKLLQSESLMAVMPKMLGHMFDLGMSAEKIAAKFAVSMNKILPLVGIGVSSYDSYRLHHIATEGEWGGTKYEHPDVRALALVGSYVNGLDTAVSVAELILDIPSAGGASVALLGANVFLALTELGLDLMLDYYNGPPPVPMGETVRSGVRMAATACAAIDPSISMDQMYTFGSIMTGQDLSLTIEALKGKTATPEQKAAFTERLKAQLANNQLGEAELARTLIREFQYSNGLNVTLKPEELNKLVGPEFLKLALQMLLSDPKSGDEALIQYLVDAGDQGSQGALKSMWIESRSLRGDALLAELGKQFGIPLADDTAKDIETLIGSNSFKALSPALQKQLYGQMVLQISDPAKVAKLAQQVFAGGDESVKLEVLAKLPPSAPLGFIKALSPADLDFLKAQQAKDPTGAILGKLVDGLLKQPDIETEIKFALSQLIALAPASTQAKLLEKVLASYAHKALAAELVTGINDPAGLALLPLDKIAKEASPEGGAKLYAHVLAKAAGVPALAPGLNGVAHNLPLNSLLQALSQQLGISPPLQVGTFGSEAGAVEKLVIAQRDSLSRLDQSALLRLGHVLAVDGSVASTAALTHITRVLSYDAAKTQLAELLTLSDKNDGLAVAVASLVRAAAEKPDFAKFATEADLAKAAGLLARRGDMSGLSQLLSGLVKADNLPADKFAAIIAAMPPATLVGSLNQLGSDGAAKLLGALTDGERLAVFKQVVAAQGADFSNGMKYARMLLNIPAGEQLKEGMKFSLPANAAAMLEALATPELLAKLSESNGGAEVVSWIVAFGDRGQNEKVFEQLQKTNSWLKDHSDVLVGAFKLAEQAGIPDSALKGKLSAKSLYFMAGPLNSGADALVEMIGASKEFTQDLKLLVKLANLTDSEGRAALINSLLDNKTYDLLLVSWNASEVENLIDKIYDQDPSAGLISRIKPERFADRFAKHAGEALELMLKSKEPGRDAYLAKMAGQLSVEQLRTFVNMANPALLKDVQQTLPAVFAKLDLVKDEALLLKLAAAGTADTRAALVKSLVPRLGGNDLIVKLLQQSPAGEVLAKLDLDVLGRQFSLDPANLQNMLDLVEKQGSPAGLKTFVEQIPASALLDSLAHDAGLRDYRASGDLSADIAALLAATDLKAVGYSVAPHMDKLFRLLKANNLSVDEGQIKSLVSLAGFVPPADRAKLLQGVLSETIVDDADAQLLEGVLKQASPADFKTILTALGAPALKTLGAEVGEAADKGLLVDLLGRLAQTQDAGLLDSVLAGVKPADMVSRLAAMPPADQAALMSSLSEKQYLSLGKQVLAAGNKEALDVFARMIGVAEGTSFPQKNIGLRGQMLDELANQLKSFTLAEGGDQALSWLIGLGEKSSVDKAFRNFKDSWANRADIVVKAVRLAQQQNVPLKERLSGETLRLMMPTLNNGWDYISSIVGNKDFDSNMALITDLAKLTDDRGRAHIVNGLIDKKTLDFFGLGYQAQPVKDIIKELVGTSKSYAFVLHLDPANVVAYFEPDKIAEMLATLSKSSEKGKDKAIQGILTAAQKLWGSKDIATTRAFFSGFVARMGDAELKTIPGSLRQMFDVLNSNSGTIRNADYAAMVKLSRGVDAEGKKYMVMQMLDRWKNITDFVVTDNELKTALSILSQDGKGVIAQFSDAEIGELVSKFSGSTQMATLLDQFETQASPAQLERMLKRLTPDELLQSLAADSRRTLMPSGDPLKDLEALFANGTPATGYDIQTHLRVLIGKLDFATAPAAAAAVAKAGDQTTQALVLKDIIPDMYYTYVSTGEGGTTEIPNTLNAAQLKVITATLASNSGQIDALLKQIGPEIRNLAASAEYMNPEVRGELQKVMLALAEAKDHGPLQALIKEMPPKGLLELWDNLNGTQRVQLMSKLSDPDRMAFFQVFVQAGKIDPARAMLNGLDIRVDTGAVDAANRDVSGATKNEMLQYLSKNLGVFKASSQDMAQAGLMLILNSPVPNQENPDDPANVLLDTAFKSILDSGWFGNGAEAVGKIISYTKANYKGDEGMNLLAGKLSPRAMGYAADNLDSFWTWMTSNEGDAKNMQFVRDLAQFATPEGKAGIITALLDNWTTTSRENLIRDIIVGVKPQQKLEGQAFVRMLDNLAVTRLSDEEEDPKVAGQILAAIISRYPPGSDLDKKVCQMFDDYSTWANSGSAMMASMLDTLESEKRTGSLAHLDVTVARIFNAYGTEAVKQRLGKYMTLP